MRFGYDVEVHWTHVLTIPWTLLLAGRLAPCGWRGSGLKTLKRDVFS